MWLMRLGFMDSSSPNSSKVCVLRSRLNNTTKPVSPLKRSLFIEVVKDAGIRRCLYSSSNCVRLKPVLRWKAKSAKSSGESSVLW